MSQDLVQLFARRDYALNKYIETFLGRKVLVLYGLLKIVFVEYQHTLDKLHIVHDIVA